MIELKWNKNAEGAIDQIINKKYPSVIKDYGKQILLVGITYDKDAKTGEKKHICRIVEFQR